MASMEEWKLFTWKMKIIYILERKQLLCVCILDRGDPLTWAGSGLQWRQQQSGSTRRPRAWSCWRRCSCCPLTLKNPKNVLLIRLWILFFCFFLNKQQNLSVSCSKICFSTISHFEKEGIREWRHATLEDKVCSEAVTPWYRINEWFNISKFP